MWLSNLQPRAVSHRLSSLEFAVDDQPKASGWSTRLNARRHLIQTVIEVCTIHATVVAAWRVGGWSGVLLRGPSGAGKSGLALRLVVERGWRLVADDRAVTWASGGRAYARAPAALAGLIEVRTVGVLPLPALPWAALALVVDCVSDPRELERIPGPAWAEVAGVRLPRLALNAGSPDGAAKLDLGRTPGAAAVGRFDRRRDWRIDRGLTGPRPPPGASSPMRTA